MIMELGYWHLNKAEVSIKSIKSLLYLNALGIFDNAHYAVL